MSSKSSGFRAEPICSMSLNQSLTSQKKEYYSKVHPQVPDICNISIDLAERDLYLMLVLILTAITIKKIQKLLNIYDSANTLSSEPTSKHNMKIHLTSDVPFLSAPRRFTYRELEEVGHIIKDHLLY